MSGYWTEQRASQVWRHFDWNQRHLRRLPRGRGGLEPRDALAITRMGGVFHRYPEPARAAS